MCRKSDSLLIPLIAALFLHVFGLSSLQTSFFISNVFIKLYNLDWSCHLCPQLTESDWY